MLFVCVSIRKFCFPIQYHSAKIFMFYFKILVLLVLNENDVNKIHPLTRKPMRGNCVDMRATISPMKDATCCFCVVFW